jgi:hypothetical protein
MDKRGWVYIITNKSMPGLLKVGYSSKDPIIRAKELAQTGLAHPYIVQYDVLIKGPRDIEQQVHKVLHARREGKEWFRCSINEAVKVIRTLVAGKVLLENISHNATENTTQPPHLNEMRSGYDFSNQASYDAWRKKRLSE